MTDNEAIKILTLSPQMKKEIPNLVEVYDVAVKALEEIQQYRAIGLTPKMVKEMIESEKLASHAAIIRGAELELYQAIGTVEECRTAVEKMKPKKPILSKEQNVRYVSKYDCPSCGKSFIGTCSKSCYHCGQKLDWSE